MTPPRHAERVVEAEGLLKRFGRFTAVDGFNLLVNQGEVHGFLGPNGAGKSTTIRMLLGLYRRDAGRLLVLGHDPQREPAAVTRRISYVPGDVSLWPTLSGQQCLDALAGIRGRGRYDESRERELVEAFALDPSKRVRSYSKGNRQKVALIAAFAARTELLILDEPTSGLDPLMEQTFQRCVRQASDEGRTVLLSSHILGEVDALCERVTIIKDGHLVDAGDVAKMKHLASVTITAALRDNQMPAGLPSPTRQTDGRITMSVASGDAPAVLRQLLDAGATDLTCTQASLDEVFLQHYEVTAR